MLFQASSSAIRNQGCYCPGALQPRASRHHRPSCLQPSQRVIESFASVTVNQELAVEEYPLPMPEYLFSNLAGGRIFSKLDLSQAYLQLPVDEASKPFLTINTYKGLYVYNRLPFGVASAPAHGHSLARNSRSGLLHR